MPTCRIKRSFEKPSTKIIHTIAKKSLAFSVRCAILYPCSRSTTNSSTIAGANPSPSKTARSSAPCVWHAIRRGINTRNRARLTGPTCGSPSPTLTGKWSMRTLRRHRPSKNNRKKSLLFSCSLLFFNYEK